MPPSEDNVYEVEEMLNQPGTYFNPQTEVVVVVDDSASPDQEVFNNLEGYEGAEWVRVSDDVPVDEDGRDRALEGFETSNQGERARRQTRSKQSEDDFEEEDERPGARPRAGGVADALRGGQGARPSRCPTRTARRSSSPTCKGETVVLYFYPRADTPGCTTQACGVRDRSADYEAAGARVIGISPDEVGGDRQVRRQVRPRLHPARRRRPRGRREVRRLGREVDVRQASTWASPARPSSSTRRARSPRSSRRFSRKSTTTSC